MFTHDPRSAKVSKGFESPNLQGRVNSPGSSIFAARTLRTGRLRCKSWNSSLRIGSGSSGCGGLVSISGCCRLVWEMVASLKYALIALIELEGYTTYLPLHQYARMRIQQRLVREQDELPSSVRLEFQARLDGGQMYSGHLEAKRLP
ncbi:hypothetical protein Tco_1483219 [Tanacetum coccineum]